MELLRCGVLVLEVVVAYRRRSRELNDVINIALVQCFSAAERVIPRRVYLFTFVRYIYIYTYIIYVLSLTCISLPFLLYLLCA